jgi:hypothetical protein
MKSDSALPTRDEIVQMLSFIPSKPDYATWLKIASAVWSVLPLVEGCQVLAAWSPEQRQGEYLSKHRYRLKRIGIGTLAHLAMHHGYKPKREHAGVVLFAETPSRTTRTRSILEMLNPKSAPLSSRSTQTKTAPQTAQAQKKPTVQALAPRRFDGAAWHDDVTEAEAARIAAELSELRKRHPELSAAQIKREAEGLRRRRGPWRLAAVADFSSTTSENDGEPFKA